VDGDFLACGSETSDLYVYYRALSKPVAQQAFTTAADLGDGDTHVSTAGGAARGHASAAMLE
jgi:hypothetical protein